MIININKYDYNKLLKICRNSKLEQYGLIRLKIDNDKINFLDVTESTGEELISTTPNDMRLDKYEFIKYNLGITLLFDPKEEIWVLYHTHPGLTASIRLSKKDIGTFKYKIYLRNKAYREILKITPPMQIDAVITEDEVGFYSIIDEKIVKHEVKVDGNVINPGKDGYMKLLKRLVNRIRKDI